MPWMGWVPAGAMDPRQKSALDEPESGRGAGSKAEKCLG
ncbi:hypothetical protein B8V81_2388 [Paenibacillus pasadenensis]|uniref:Uncharacterized protein n=1 Tax=Paenibacillus pasadenensis TaxID=217090 RepID=A0A2N5N0U4_9BACL|nr:hypothetical protein B8V81_2388 [Paenibacillus pasadenensis]